ncbi:hypothetical protein FHS28_003402 [Roseateles terrae]|uniref:Uncharacterized protein n=1 Tax=Roseateles terrae TaxID=431060 RepID=A0ABR6GV52_9BURK|nr:hypothetical protein [Roseateles terrae]
MAQPPWMPMPTPIPTQMPTPTPTGPMLSAWRGSARRQAKPRTNATCLVGVSAPPDEDHRYTSAQASMLPTAPDTAHCRCSVGKPAMGGQHQRADECGATGALNDRHGPMASSTGMRVPVRVPVRVRVRVRVPVRVRVCGLRWVQGCSASPAGSVYRLRDSENPKKLTSTRVGNCRTASL